MLEDSPPPSYSSFPEENQLDPLNLKKNEEIERNFEDLGLNNTTNSFSNTNASAPQPQDFYKNATPPNPLASKRNSISQRKIHSMFALSNGSKSF